MLNEHGGVVDDMIVYRTESGYRLVVNAATRDQDMAWMQARLGAYDVQLHERSSWRCWRSRGLMRGTRSPNW